MEQNRSGYMGNMSLRWVVFGACLNTLGAAAFLLAVCYGGLAGRHWWWLVGAMCMAASAAIQWVHVVRHTRSRRERPQ
jgi:hypothetical protein